MIRTVLHLVFLRVSLLCASTKGIEQGCDDNDRHHHRQEVIECHPDFSTPHRSLLFVKTEARLGRFFRLDNCKIALLKPAVEFTQNPTPSLFERAFHLDLLGARTAKRGSVRMAAGASGCGRSLTGTSIVRRMPVSVSIRIRIMISSSVREPDR
jgi:hypothetical protein